MPFSNRPETGTTIEPMQNYTVLAERYALLRCMAETALGKLYWAQDKQHSQHNGANANVLIFTVLPALAQQATFEQALRQVLPNYQRADTSNPVVVNHGKTANGIRWFAIQNITGMLLSERLLELDERGMALADAYPLLEDLTEALACQRPLGIFGYLEPGAVLLSDSGPLLLAAPVASALRIANTTNSEPFRQTLYSRYLSPDILLGVTPTAADDTFSLACIAYHLLQGQPPFGVHSPLEAVVRNISPLPSRKLPQTVWTALQQGLSMQRAARQPDPMTLLQALQSRSQKKFLLPVAALVAASAVAFTTYHLLSNWQDKPAAVMPEVTAQSAPTPEPTTPPANTLLVDEKSAPEVPDKEAPQFEIDQLAAEAKERAEADQKAGDVVATDEAAAQTTSIGKLLESATEAIRKGQLLSDNPDKPAAVDYLRKLRTLEPENATAQKLLTQMVNDQQAEAEALLADKRLDEASQLLSTADKLITEFSLNDNLSRQVKLETEINEQKRQQTLEKENPAINASTETDKPTTTDKPIADNTTTTPATEDKSAYINDAKQAQEEALAYLRKGNTSKARTYLDQSQSLISKYQLDKLVEEQIALEKRFRETPDTASITASSQEQGKPNDSTSNKAVNDTSTGNKITAANKTDSQTASQTESTQPVERPVPNPTRNTVTVVSTVPPSEPVVSSANRSATAETAAPEFVSLPNTEQKGAVTAATTEVSLSPDIPVREATTTELPPIQLDVPPARPQRSNRVAVVPANAAQSPDAGVEVTASPPASNPRNMARSTHVPDLIELPIESIDANLPNPANNR